MRLSAVELGRSRICECGAMVPDEQLDRLPSAGRAVCDICLYHRAKADSAVQIYGEHAPAVHLVEGLGDGRELHGRDQGERKGGHRSILLGPGSLPLATQRRRQGKISRRGACGAVGGDTSAQYVSR